MAARTVGQGQWGYTRQSTRASADSSREASRDSVKVDGSSAARQLEKGYEETC